MNRLLLFLLFAPLLTAQTPEVEITAEPHHHLTFENKSVRVFNVEVPPNDATLLHWHRHDYIAVTLAPAEITNTVKDKPAVSVKFTAGDTRFAPATFAHIVRTTSPQAFRNVTVELLEDATLRTSATKWDDDRSLDILQGGTRQILFVKDNVRVSEWELQPGAVVSTQSRSHPFLLIAVSDLDLFTNDPRTHGPPEPVPTPSHFKSGDFKWLPGHYSHTLINSGKTTAKFVTLEFP
jgi:hypothetical protein